MQNPSDLHLTQILTNMSVQMPPQEFVAQEVLPLLGVKKKADQYYKYDVKERLRLADNGGLRAPGAYTAEVDFRVSRDDYSCDTYAFGDFVEDTEISNADAPLDPYADAQEGLVEEAMRHMEKRVADLVFAQATYPAAQRTQLSSTSQWSHADSDPINAILTARAECHGKKPNCLLINEDVELALLKHAKILSRLTGGAYTGNPANVTLEDIAKLCRLDKVIVGTAEYDSTGKRSATTTRSPIWGKHALLYYYESKPGLKKVSLGYTFSWNEFGGSKGYKTRVIRNDERGDGGRKIIVEQCVDHKIVSTDVAYFFEDAVA